MQYIIGMQCTVQYVRVLEYSAVYKSIGVLEYWSIGVLEYSAVYMSIRVLEYAPFVGDCVTSVRETGGHTALCTALHCAMSIV